jgi:transposase
MSQHKSGIPFSHPKQGKKPKSEFFQKYDFKQDLNNHIYRLNENNKYFTMADLYHYAKNELDYIESLTTFRSIVKTMGYQYKKVNNRKILIESPRLKSLKIKFLRKYLQYKEENALFVFLDETWIYQNGAPIRRWLNENDRRTMPKKITVTEGKRFTVLHAGCKFGFLEGCKFLLNSNIDSADYHKTMNGELFKKWVEEQLVPSLQCFHQKVVVVMDNAPYHSVLVERPPTYSWNKLNLQSWLTERKIPFSMKLTKKELMTIIRSRIGTKKYQIDELLHTQSVEVLRLPPYNCQYNPIELVWGFCKPYYNKNISSQQSQPSKKKSSRRCMGRSAIRIYSKNVE